MEDVTKMLALIAVFIALVPSFIALIRIRQLQAVQKKLSILVWGATLIGILSWYIASMLKTSNLPLLHIYTIFEFTMLSLIYQKYVGTKRATVLIITFVLFAGYNSIFVDHFSTFNVLARSVSALLAVFYAVTFFAISLGKMRLGQLEKVPFFWISCGVLLYYGASLFIFLFSADILPHDELFFLYWSAHAVFTILLYLIYSIALWVQPQK